MIYIKHHLFSDYCQNNFICMKQATIIFNIVQRKDRWNPWIYCYDAGTCRTQRNESLQSSSVVLCCQISLTACAKLPPLKEQTAPSAEHGHQTHRGNNELCAEPPEKQRRGTVKKEECFKTGNCYKPYRQTFVVSVLLKFKYMWVD